MSHISNLTVTEFRDIVDDFRSKKNWGSPEISAGIILWLTQRDRRFLPVKAIAYSWALSEPAFKKELKTYGVLTTVHDRIGTPHTLDATALDPKSLEWLLECYENVAEDKRDIRLRANRAAPTLLKEIEDMRKSKTQQLEMALSSIEGTSLEACAEELTASGVGFRIVLGAGKEKWMQKVSKSIEQHGTKNSLHHYFKIPEGETIPLTLLKRTLKKPGISSKTKHRILFALNARKAKHGKKATAASYMVLWPKKADELADGERALYSLIQSRKEELGIPDKSPLFSISVIPTGFLFSVAFHVRGQQRTLDISYNHNKQESFIDLRNEKEKMLFKYVNHIGFESLKYISRDVTGKRAFVSFLHEVVAKCRDYKGFGTAE